MARKDTRHTIKFEPGLWEWIQNHIEQNPQKGYSGATEFVKRVVRDYLEEHGPPYTPRYKDDDGEEEEQL